jgi:hypothetical protein
MTGLVFGCPGSLCSLPFAEGVPGPCQPLPGPCQPLPGLRQPLPGPRLLYQACLCQPYQSTTTYKYLLAFGRGGDIKNPRSEWSRSLRPGRVSKPTTPSEQMCPTTVANPILQATRRRPLGPNKNIYLLIFRGTKTPSKAPPRGPESNPRARKRSPRTKSK